ncbi:MAG: chalcone isomerase family protein [Burkholderiales bacterium]|nr:chalcone isomerase family protein [Burkholderiales bacterium]
MRFMKPLLGVIVSALLSASAMAATIDLAGVKVEDSAVVGGAKLPLNGAGIRVKFLKIYVGELFVGKKVHTLQELIAAPGPKRLKMTFLREVDSNAFGKLLTRGVQDNVAKDQFSRMVPGLIRMGEMFGSIKSLGPGDVVTDDWIPGTGLVVTVNGKVQGEPITDPEFFHGLMSIWFGPNPGDWKLKDAMLDVK